MTHSSIFRTVSCKKIAYSRLGDGAYSATIIGAVCIGTHMRRPPGSEITAPSRGPPMSFNTFRPLALYEMDTHPFALTSFSAVIPD
jgi:hypothetical protein